MSIRYELGRHFETIFEVNGFHDCPNPTTDIKIGDELQPSGLKQRGEVVDDTIGHRLMEVALFPERPQIQFERFQLDAKLIGNIS